MAFQQPCRTPYHALSAVEQHLRAHRTLGRRAALRALRKDINHYFRPILDSPLVHNLPSQQALQMLGEDIASLLLGWECHETVLFQWEFGLLEQEGSLGVTWYSAPVGKTVVSIEPYPNGGGRSRTDSLLNTLAHEVVHAYFRNVACDGRRCGTYACECNSQCQLGRGGHGDAFLRLCALVEREVWQQSLWHVNLDLRTEAQWFCDAERVFLQGETVAICWPGKRMVHRFVWWNGRPRLILVWS